MIYFLNPHTSAVGDNLVNIVAKHPSFAKFFYLQEPIKNGEINIFVYRASSFAINKLPIGNVLKGLLSILEYKIWCKVNLLSAKKTFYSVRQKEMQLNQKKIMIVDTNVEFVGRDKLLDELYNNGFQFAFYISHFHVRTKQKLNLIKKYRNSIIFSEAFPRMPQDLTDVQIYREKFIFLPYAVKPKFVKKDNIVKEKSNKILVTGVVVRDHGRVGDQLQYDYGSRLLHPLRVELFDKREILDQILHNISAEYSLAHNNSYFNISLVDMYDSHQFFICPEDITGVPSSNMVEGMARGCIYFGDERLEYLKNYGMRPWLHYIPYDGTVNGLLEARNKILDNSNLIQQISRNGAELAKAEFSGDRVRTKLFEHLYAMKEL